MHNGLITLALFGVIERVSVKIKKMMYEEIMKFGLNLYT